MLNYLTIVEINEDGSWCAPIESLLGGWTLVCRMESLLGRWIMVCPMESLLGGWTLVCPIESLLSGWIMVCPIESLLGRWIMVCPHGDGYLMGEPPLIKCCDLIFMLSHSVSALRKP